MASITLQVWTYSERIICGETGGVECRYYPIIILTVG